MTHTSDFPSFSVLREFIRENPKASICEIRDEFNQCGDDVVSRHKPGCSQKQLVLAYGINGEFFRYLQSFIKEEDVVVDADHVSCMVSDNTLYTGPGEFVPILLSIN